MLQHDRREFLKLAGMAGVTFTAGLFAGQTRRRRPAPSFHFVQFSDTHWGYKGAANPDAENTLAKAVATVNGLAQPPDFIIFTGDLTHTTDDPKERRARMQRFREIVSALRVKDVRFMPGEHDAALDKGEAYKEFFGAPYYTFDHKGVHFIALDNTTDPGAKLGRGAARLAGRRSQAAQDRRPDRRADASAAVRPPTELGLDDRRRRQGHRAADALPERRGVLRPHPPGASPHDGPHRPSCGQVADLSAHRTRLAAQARTTALRCRPDRHWARAT